MKKNILVTGSSGYVGSNYINMYAKKYEIRTFSLLTDDLKSINYDGLDIILHCAALVHKKVEYPYEEYYKINVEYPISLAKKAKASGVKQFVLISSIAVYGEEKQLVHESTECNPATSYGKSKLAVEQQLLALNDEDFIVSIIRPPMVYGKDAPGNIDRLIKLVKKVHFLPFGDIKNRRSFIYIGNLCHLIDTIIEKNASGIYLAADDKPLSTTKLIESIAEALDKNIYLLKVPFFPQLLKFLKPSFYQRLYGSLELKTNVTNERLDFKNKYTTREGIKFMTDGESR